MGGESTTGFSQYCPAPMKRVLSINRNRMLQKKLSAVAPCTGQNTAHTQRACGNPHFPLLSVLCDPGPRPSCDICAEEALQEATGAEVLWLSAQCSWDAMKVRQVLIDFLNILLHFRLVLNLQRSRKFREVVNYRIPIYPTRGFSCCQHFMSVSLCPPGAWLCKQAQLSAWHSQVTKAPT